MKKRESNEQTLKEAIDRLLEVYKLKGKLDQVKLVDSWEEIMGKPIARHTTDIKFYDKRLVVKLNSSVLREELSYGKSKIIAMLNERAGQNLVEEIDFR